MLSIFKNEKFWCVVAGAAGVIIGKKILTSPKTRELTVNGLAKGMKLQDDAKNALQNLRDDAADVCYDARTQAGLNKTEDNDNNIDDETADDSEEATSADEA